MYVLQYSNLTILFLSLLSRCLSSTEVLNPVPITTIITVFLISDYVQEAPPVPDSELGPSDQQAVQGQNMFPTGIVKVSGGFNFIDSFWIRKTLSEDRLSKGGKS